MTTTAVTVLLMEPSRYWTSACGSGTSPRPADQTSPPSRTTPATRLGARPSRWTRAVRARSVRAVEGRTGSGMTATVARTVRPRRSGSGNGLLTGQPVVAGGQPLEPHSGQRRHGADEGKHRRPRRPAQHPARRQCHDDVRDEDRAVDRSEDVHADLGGLQDPFDEHAGEESDPGAGLGDGDDAEG